MRRSDGVQPGPEHTVASDLDSQLPPTDLITEPASLAFPHIPVAGLRNRRTRESHYFRDFATDGAAKRIITIGRGHHCDIRLERRTISKLHCVIERVDALWTIRDTSSNGTLIYRPEDPIAQPLEDLRVVLSLNMHILIEEIAFLPISDGGKIGLFAVHQKQLRRRAFTAYQHAGEAAHEIGCSKTTIYDAQDTELPSHG